MRRARPDLRGETLEWVDLGPDAIAFRRGRSTLSVTNFGAEPLPLPPHRELLVASAPVRDGALPADSTAWLGL
jgi:alpha-glucosidase